MEDATNFRHFAYTTNSFDIKELKIYEKAMASNQAKEWAEAIQQKI